MVIIKGYNKKICKILHIFYNLKQEQYIDINDLFELDIPDELLDILEPEEDEEFDDDNFQKKITGLGLVDFAIMPHMNSANEVDELGHPSVMQMCLEDSYDIPHYGICDYGFIEIKDGKSVAYGKTMLLKNGECIELCGDKECIGVSSKYLNETEKSM